MKRWIKAAECLKKKTSSPKINGEIRLTVFLHAAACPTLTLGWTPRVPGLFPAECTRLGLPSWDAIKSQQSDPWVIDERRSKREEEGGFGKGCFKSVTLCCLVALNTLLLQTEGLGSFVTCSSCSFTKMFSSLSFCKTFMTLFLVTAPVQAMLTGTSLVCS